MKRFLFSTGILLLFLFLLAFPAEALSAAQQGLNLWLNTLLPTLLPFLILTGLLMGSDGIQRVLSPAEKLWKSLFGLSGSGAYALFLGLLCGYPMGAKTASDLYTNGHISQRETEYLLTFCNNASPAFITTYLAHICLEGQIPLRSILSVLIISDLLCMLFFRFIVYQGNTCTDSPGYSHKKETSRFRSQGTLIDVSIMNGFETITRLGGYILLFTLVSACISHFLKVSTIIRCSLLGALEISTGLNQIARAALSIHMKYLLSMTATSFGGLCILAQTRSVLNEKLSIKPYITAKLINAALTAVLVSVFFQIV